MYPPATGPLSIGQTLDQGFRLFKASFSRVWLFAFVSGLIALPMNLTAPQTPEDFADGLALWIGAFLLYLVLSIVIFSAMVLRVGSVANGTPLGIGESLRQGLRRSPSLLGTGVLYALICFFGLLLLIVPGIWLSVAFIFAMYAAVLDNKDPIDSLGYSWQLVKGNWWRTAVVLTIIVIIAGVIYGLLAFVVGILTAMGEISEANTAGVVAFFELVVMPLVSIILVPLTYALFIAFYLDVRLRREGTDLAARIDAAG